MDMHPQELFRMAGVSEVSESEKFQKNSSTKRSSERVTAKQSYDNLTPKSYFMHRSKSDTFHDAHLSFDLAMRTAVYSQSGPLPARPRKALQEFLTFMKKTIPLNSSMQPVVRDLLDNFEKVVTHVNSLNEIMARHSPPKPKNKWSAASSQHGTGYTAGLWILFHIMSVGLVHWNHLAMDDGQKIIPSKMADSQRNYVEHFFQCEECRLNFLADFDACMYDRCNRLVTTIDKATAQDFLQYPLWLYETHNAVNTRLRKERIDQGIESDDLTSQAGVSWPPMSFCPSCWLSIEEGRWDELEVYKFLEDTYWLGGRHSGVLEVQRPNEGETKPMSLANSNAKEIDAADASSISYMLLLCPISFIGILILYRKRQFIQKGIHKK